MPDDAEARRALRRLLAPRLADLGTSFALVVEDVLGEGDGVIDWVAAAPDGRAWVVLIAAGDADASLLEAGLAQRAWVEDRIPDWRKLAPELPLRGELTPGVLLVAHDYARTTRIAAREASAGGIALARWSGSLPSGPIELAAVPTLMRVARTTRPTVHRLVSTFRTALRDADLAN